MELFGKEGIMTQIFSVNDNVWKSYKMYDKAKHSFMVNRLMSIQFPTQAQQLNRNGMNPYVIVETWRMLVKPFKRTPNWLFTKINKPNKIEKTKSKYIPSEEVISLYITKNEISRNQFNEILRLYPQEILKYLEKLQKQMEVYE